jgi:hypothetical protein
MWMSTIRSAISHRTRLSKSSPGNRDRGEHAIEAAITKWAIVVLGVLIVVAATVPPWFSAHAVGGSAEMAGWGAWRTSGSVDASLRPLPLAVFVYLPAALMIWGAVRRSFGLAVVGAMAAFAGGVLPYMLMPVATRSVPGSEAVGISVAAAPALVVAVTLVATVVCWIGYARCVLRAAPRAEA